MEHSSVYKRRIEEGVGGDHEWDKGVDRGGPR
jgi:hypothetical protein